MELKVFVSVQESYKTPEQARRRAEAVEARVLEAVEGVSFAEPDRSRPRLVADLEAMLGCDALVMSEDAANDPLCRLLAEAAGVYGVQRFDEGSLDGLARSFPDHAVASPAVAEAVAEASGSIGDIVSAKVEEVLDGMLADRLESALAGRLDAAVARAAKPALAAE